MNKWVGQHRTRGDNYAVTSATFTDCVLQEATSKAKPCHQTHTMPLVDEASSPNVGAHICKWLPNPNPQQKKASAAEQRGPLCIYQKNIGN